MKMSEYFLTDLGYVFLNFLEDFWEFLHFGSSSNALPNFNLIYCDSTWHHFNHLSFTKYKGNKVNSKGV